MKEHRQILSQAKVRPGRYARMFLLLLVNPPLCECGHFRQAHTHYRRGSECSACRCPRWRGSRRNTLRAAA